MYAANEFKCKDRCTSCCESPGLIIDPTLADMYRIGLYRNKGILDVFEESCKTWFRDHSGTDIIIAFDMPCHYIEDNLCGIHPYKPIVCRISPEMHFMATDKVRKQISRFIPCLSEDMAIDAKVARNIRKLQYLGGIEEQDTKEAIYSPSIILSSDPTEYFMHHPIFRDNIRGKEEDIPFTIKCQQDALAADFLETILKRLEKAVKKTRVMDKIKRTTERYFAISR
ncbi:MAG: YkgJ family cysteine cluster protein [Nanoarchaeota archaeon]